MDWNQYTEQLESIAWPDYLIVVIYILFILIYGIFKARNVKHADDFLVAGRSLGLFVLTGTLVMTELNTATAIGWSAFGYRAGLWSLILLLCFAFGLGSYTLLVAKRWKRLDAVSIAEMAQARFGSRMRALVAFLTISSLCVFGPGYLKAASMVFSIGIGDYQMQYIGWTTTVLCLIVLAFTLAGGLVSVVWTDTASMIITLITLPILFGVCYVKGGGMVGLTETFGAQYATLNPAGKWNDAFVPGTFVVAIYMLLFLIYCQAPWYGQRMFAAKNPRTAYLAMIFATVLIIIGYALYLGSAAFARAGFERAGLPPLPFVDQEKAIAIAIVQWMPMFFKGLMLSMIFAVCQTTLSSIWNTNVSMIVQDVYKAHINPQASDRQMLSVSRWVTILVAGLTVLLALKGERIIDYLFFANVFQISIFFLTLGGFLFWGVTHKATWIVTFISILVGFWVYLGKETADGIQTVYLFGIKLYSGPVGGEPWLYVLCVYVMPVVCVVGALLCLLLKDDKEDIATKVRFFERCGAPLVGKAKFEAARATLKNGEQA